MLFLLLRRLIEWQTFSSPSLLSPPQPAEEATSPMQTMQLAPSDELRLPASSVRWSRYAGTNLDLNKSRKIHLSYENAKLIPSHLVLGAAAALCSASLVKRMDPDEALQ